MISEQGQIFYKDEYEQLYQITWKPRGNNQIDITTITLQPYIWGKARTGYIENHILYRKGLVTVTEQVIRITDDGYIIEAEGSSQYEDYIQINYNGNNVPRDIFKYHLNSQVHDEVDGIVVEGSRWADPDSSQDDNMIWDDLNNDGSPSELTATGDNEYLAWIDVWAN